MIERARPEREERKQEIASVHNKDESNLEASAVFQLWCLKIGELKYGSFFFFGYFV